MAWKDQYIDKYGSRAGIQPSAKTGDTKTQTWKERYQKQMEERAAEQEARLAEQEAENKRREQENEKQSEWADTYGEITDQQQSLYKLAKEMQDTSYVSELDRQKREASGEYQSYFDAEKRSYQYSQKAEDALAKAQGIAEYLKSYPEDESSASDLLMFYAEQSAALKNSSDSLAAEAEYWKQYENADAYDEATRMMDIEARKQKAEEAAAVEARNDAYTNSKSAYYPGINLPVNQYARQQTQWDAQNRDDYNIDVTQDEMVKGIKIDPEKRSIRKIQSPLEEMPDFEELSQLGASLDNSKSIQNKVMYGRENADELEAAAFLGGAKGDKYSYYRYQNMTKEEADIYNYLLVKKGSKTAEEYLNTLEGALDARMMTKFQQGTEQYAKEYPVAASIASIGAAPLAGSAYLAEAASKAMGNDVNMNAGIHGLSNFQNTIRGTVADSLAEKYGGLASFIYQTGMSMGDSALSMLMTGGSGWIGGTLLGLNAAENAMSDAVNRGASDEQALLSGLFAGAAEMVFEKVSIDKFVKMTNTGRAALVKNMIKQAGIEASEEAATEIANTISDKLIMGDISNYDLSVQKYMNAGQSESEAKKNAMLDIAKNIGLAAAGGALSGGVFGAGGTAINAVSRGNYQETQPVADTGNIAGTGYGNASQNAQQVPDGYLDGDQDILMRAANEGAQKNIREEQARTAAETGWNADNRDLRNNAAPELTQREMDLIDSGKITAEDKTGRYIKNADGSLDFIKYDQKGNVSDTIHYDVDDPFYTVMKNDYQNLLETNARKYGNEETRAEAQNRPSEPAIAEPSNITANAEQAAYANSGKETDTLEAFEKRAEEYARRDMRYGNIEQAYSDEAFKNLDKTARESIDSSFTVMDAMAKRAGLKIRVVDTIDVNRNGAVIKSGSNGLYNASENTIDIALDAQDGAYEYIAAHELTHYIKTKNAAEYDVLAELVEDALTRNGENVSELVKAEMDRNGYDETIARDEVIANSIPAILNDEATVRRFVETNRTLAQKVADFIRQMIADIRAAGAKLAQRGSWKQMGSLSQDTQRLQEIGDLFIAALDDTKAMMEQEAETRKQNAAEEDEVPFSLKTDGDNRSIRKDNEKFQFDSKTDRITTRRELDDVVNKAREDYYTIAVRIENKPRRIGEAITENSKDNPSRIDERDFPEYGTDEYNDLPELDGVSAWRYGSSQAEDTINRAFSGNISGISGEHVYLIASDDLEYTDATRDENEIVISNAVVVAEIGQKKSEDGVTIEEHALDSYSGQTNLVVTGKIDGKTVGKLEYAEYQGTPSIQMIKVEPEYRRRGIAKQMLQALQKKYGDTEIEFGMSTKDGTELLKATTYDVKNEEYAALKKEYGTITKELQVREDKFNAGTITEEEMDGWNDLYDRQYEIQKKINEDGLKPKKTFVRFSLKDVDPDPRVDALIAENTELRKANELLREQFQLTKGNRVSAEDIRKLARRLKREYQSDVDYETLSGQLDSLFAYLAEEENPNWQDIQRVGMAIGNQVIEQSRAVDKTIYEQYADVREKLKGTRISLNDEQKAEAASMSGTYGDYRKRMFGAVNLVNDGTPLDVIWGELSDIHPELFADSLADTDMPGALYDAVEHMRPQYVNPYEMDRAEAANDVMMKAYQAYMELPKMRTFADKQKAKYDAQLEQYRGMMEKYRENIRKKYNEKLSAIRRENARMRQVLAKKINEEKSERMKAALRKQYRTLSTQNAERLAEQKARYDKWKDTDRAREKYLPRIEKSAREMADWLMKPNDSKHVPEKLKGIVNDFLSTLDFAGEKTTIRANEWRERMRDLKDAMQEIDAGDYDNIAFFAEVDPDFVPRLKDFMEETDGIRYVRDLDGNHLRELNYLMASVKRSVTYANSLYQNERYKTVAEAGERTMEELDARKEAKQLGKTLGMARDLLNHDQLDAFAYQEQLGAAGGSLIQELRNGLDVKVKDVRKTEDYAKGVIGKTNAKAIENEKRTFDVAGGRIELTKAEIMSLYCLNKRRQAQGHMYEGGIKTEKMSRPVKVSEVDVSVITGTMTPEERRIADRLQGYMNQEVAGWGNDVSMELYGYQKFTEPNYYPIKSDENYVRSQDDDSKGAGYYRLKNLGMTKSTVKGARNALVVSGIFDTFADHIDKMSSYHGFVIPISDAMKFINYKSDAGSTKESITRALGYGGKTYFTTLIKDINGVKMEKGKDIGETLLRNAKIASVGANLRVVVQQPTAYLRAMNMISPKYLMMGLLKTPGIEKSKQWCRIAQWKAYGFYDLDIGKGLKEILVGETGTADRLRNAALKPASMADEMTWGYLWNACEAETKAMRPELDVRSNEFNEAVGKRMSEIVDRTQVVDSVFHRSQIMRRKGFTQFFTTFMSEPTKTYNMVRTAAAAVMRNPQERTAWTKLTRATTTYTLTGIFTAAAAALVDTVRDDDKDKDLKSKYGTAFGANVVDVLSPLNMIPYVREIQNLSQGFRANRLDMRGVEFLWNAATNWQKWFSGNTTKSVYGLVYQTAQGLSYLGGIPVNNAMRAFEGAYKVLTGRTLDKENETATATKSYENLYQAILSGKADKVKSLRGALQNGTATLKPKSNSDIDAGIAEQMMLNEPRIAEAYAAKADGNAREVLRIKNELVREGFTGETVDKAINRYTDVTAVQKEADIAKELNVRLFSNEDMAVSIERAAKTGDEESMMLVYSELLADSTAQDPVKAVKSNITTNIKPVYLAYYEKADDRAMLAIENILIMNFGYKTSEFNEWIKAYNKEKRGSN